MKQIFYIIEKMDFGHSFLKGVSRIVCILCFALAWGIGAASAQEYLVDFSTGNLGSASGVSIEAQVMNWDNESKSYKQNTGVITHRSDHKVINIVLPCAGIGNKLTLTLKHDDTDRKWYIVQFDNENGAQSYRYDLPESSRMKDGTYEITLNPTTRSIRIGLYAGAFNYSQKGEVSNLKITYRDPQIACKDFTVLSADGQVSVDLPTIKQGEVDTWSADHGMSITGNKLNGTLPFGDNEITVTATFCERTDQCVSHIVVVKKLPACESK